MACGQYTRRRIEIKLYPLEGRRALGGRGGREKGMHISETAIIWVLVVTAVTKSRYVISTLESVRCREHVNPLIDLTCRLVLTAPYYEYNSSNGLARRSR